MSNTTVLIKFNVTSALICAFVGGVATGMALKGSSNQCSYTDISDVEDDAEVVDDDGFPTRTPFVQYDRGQLRVNLWRRRR